MTLAADVEQAAGTLLRVMNANGCAVAPATVSDFQRAFNNDYSPAISVDGKYGPQTQGALDQVIADATSDDADVYGQGTAPAACSYHAAAPAGPPPSSTTQPRPATPVLNVASAAAGGSLFESPWTWAVVLLGAAAVAISRSKHPPHWARRMGLHR